MKKELKSNEEERVVFNEKVNQLNNIIATIKSSEAVNKEESLLYMTTT